MSDLENDDLDLPPLDPALALLVDAARQEHPRDPADLEAKTLLAMGLPPTPPSPPTPPPAPVPEAPTVPPGTAISPGPSLSPYMVSWWGKPILIFAAGALVGGMTLWATTAPSRNDAPSAHPQSSVSVAPSFSMSAPDAPSVSSASSANSGTLADPPVASSRSNQVDAVVSGNKTPETVFVQPSAAASTVSVPAGSTAPDTSSTHVEPSLTEELAEIEKARAALSSGAPARAMQIVDQYEKSYPKARFRTEAAVIRIEALVASGQRSTASTLARSFLSSNPKSPYAQRIRSLFPEQAPTPPR